MGLSAGMGSLDGGVACGVVCEEGGQLLVGGDCIKIAWELVRREESHQVR
jgi:hypothetical protein